MDKTGLHLFGLAVNMLIIGRSILYMVRPHSYVGTGMLSATDPRTVQWFGRILFVLGVISFSLSLFLFFSE